MATVKEKGPRGKGAEGRRIEGKTNRKPAKRRESRDEMEDIRKINERSEQARMKHRALPFDIYHQCTLVPTWDEPDAPLDAYRWSAETSAVADAALRAGFQLGVRVRSDCIAWAVCEIVKRLKTPVYAWYSSRAERVILQMMEEDEEDE